MTATLPLAELQRRFCAWLTEPDEDRAAQLAAPLGVGPGLVVYQNTYRVALVDALREIHPRAAAWLGEAAFAAAAARYIKAHPPSRWTIDVYGAEFPAALPGGDPVAADLAAIDRAIGDAFVAADAVPANAAALADVDWEQAVIRPVPSLALLPIATNADALWLALASDEALPGATEAPGTLMVWRQGFEPVMRRADPVECRILRRSLSGAGFAAICEELAAEGDEAEAVTRAGTVLARWLGESLIAGFA
jgi:hypothetical protein